MHARNEIVTELALKPCFIHFHFSRGEKNVECICVCVSDGGYGDNNNNFKYRKTEGKKPNTQNFIFEMFEPSAQLAANSIVRVYRQQQQQYTKTGVFFFYI